jgi:hypothetical protein
VGTPIVVALISSSASLIIAISGAAWTARQNRRARELERELADAQSKSQVEVEKLKHELQRSVRSEERVSDEAALLAQYREPLLIAAYELGDRIDNIQRRAFLSYLKVPDHRGETALLSTLYRFAHYFAQQEILRSNLRFMRFRSGEVTEIVADLLEHIGRTFATDKLDWGYPVESPRFMFWREEQRAIGELMLERLNGKPEACIGYASFVNAYNERFAKWFSPFIEDLTSDRIAINSDRLARLRSLLANLVTQLDEDGIYARAGDHDTPVWPEWVMESMEGWPDPNARESELFCHIAAFHRSTGFI